jgi:type I restriction enzyme R subunit
MDNMKPEEEARAVIDQLLMVAGWSIQDWGKHDLGASLGVAIREFPLKLDSADYLLFIDRKAVGVIEAKPVGVTLGGVSEQTLKYLSEVPENLPKVNDPLPFSYESTGTETYFRDLRDPESRSRRVFAFHKPETLREWLAQEKTLRARLKDFPPLSPEGLRECQYKAITNLERSFGESRPRALIQMASGSGKTYTAVNFCYRLIKNAKAKRILFLVDRNNLGDQTRGEFEKFITPDDRRKLTELYSVQQLKSDKIDDVSKICISTIQRVYSILKGENLPEESEEGSLFETNLGDETVEVSYNPSIPIEKFDFIITDECHRSIYHLWRQVLEYFDAFIIGLTATPSKQTYGFFNQNLVSEYSHERAVADGVNVGYDVYRIKTQITDEGSRVDSNFWVGKRDRETRKTRWEQLDEPMEYQKNQLDRDVVAKDQIRTVVKAFKEAVETDLFPERKYVPKTIVFAKDDSHAEDILHIMREEFNKGNDFCKKITYRTTGDSPKSLIQDFRNSFNPRVAVTVDMISTGTDIQAVECLLFMRDIRSQVYFEQMKGRGTRTIKLPELQQASPDAKFKDHFVIVDAVGVCESDKTDSRPLERKRDTSFKSLLDSVSLGVRDEDSITSLANRLSRLDRRLSPDEQKEIVERTGHSLRNLVNGLLDAVDPDKFEEKAKQLYNVETPSPEQLGKAADELAKEACEPFVGVKVRDVIIEIKTRNEQTIDEVSKDEVIFSGFDAQAKEKAQHIVKSFSDFLEAHKDELLAIQIIYNRPYGSKPLTYQAIKELAEALLKSSNDFTTEKLWSAYQQLDQSKVKGTGPVGILTNIISLVRFAAGNSEILEPYSVTVERNFNEWLSTQTKKGRTFTPIQLQWLEMIRDHIGSSSSIILDDLENVPFQQRGGTMKAFQLFGQELNLILDELNLVLNK